MDNSAEFLKKKLTEALASLVDVAERAEGEFAKTKDMSYAAIGQEATSIAERVKDLLDTVIGQS